MALFSDKFKSISVAPGKPFMSITKNGITFNKACLARLSYPTYVVPLVNNEDKQFALQVVAEETIDSLVFSKNGKRDINVRYNAATFMDTITEIMNWNLKEHSYKVYGEYITDGIEVGMLFNLQNAEISDSDNQVSDQN